MAEDPSAAQGGARLRDQLASPYALTAIAALVVFVILITGSPTFLIYDEGYYMAGATMLAGGASFRELLLAPLNVPAGPLYSVTHWLASPFTGLEAPGVRWVSFVLLVATWGATGYVLAAQKLDAPWRRAAMLLAVPMLWVTSGMALTEGPAMAFVCFAVAAAAWAMTGQKKARVWAGFLIAGLCFGLAVLGRQPYLPAAIGFLCIALFRARLRWPALAAFLIVLGATAPVFAIWGGILPPRMAGEVSGGRLAPFNGFLAFCYLGVMLAILAPDFFLKQWRVALPAGIIGAVIGLIVGGVGFEVAAGLVARLPEDYAPLFQRVAAGALMGGALAVIAASGAHLWARRDDHAFVLCMLLMLGLTATAAGIVHQFSSRYVLATLPFSLIVIQPFFRVSHWAALRLAIGALLGMAFLSNYFALDPFTTDCTHGPYGVYCSR
ncbi:MAG: hypothetical protein JNJ73_20675 [Hyphomonadaceae bacterium]|nr:hypothetical protein [Hyphomonadaceae bacterium]